MSTKPISRRNFLKASAVAVGAGTLTCCGLGYAASRAAGPQMAIQQAPQTPGAGIETPTFSFGKDPLMEKRILVAYATRTGSTVGVAAAIGETLGARGYTVDVKPVKENPSLDGYQAAIIGSAVNGARWLPEAVQYVENNRSAFNRVPVALFCVHIMNMGDSEKSIKNRLAYLNAVRPLVKPLHEAFFAGIGMEPGEKSWFIRWASRIFKIGEGDCRDWNKIQGWAQTVFA